MQLERHARICIYFCLPLTYQLAFRISCSTTLFPSILLLAAETNTNLHCQQETLNEKSTIARLFVLEL